VVLHQNVEIPFVADSGNTALILTHTAISFTSLHKKQYKMVSDTVTQSVEQCCVIKFLVKEKVKLAEILCRLSALYGEGTMSHAGVYDWCSKFSECHQLVANQPHDHMELTAVVDVKICRTEELILENRQIKV
jgi:hypothetical protein